MSRKKDQHELLDWQPSQETKTCESALTSRHRLWVSDSVERLGRTQEQSPICRAFQLRFLPTTAKQTQSSHLPATMKLHGPVVIHRACFPLTASRWESAGKTVGQQSGSDFMVGLPLQLYTVLFFFFYSIITLYDVNSDYVLSCFWHDRIKIVIENMKCAIKKEKKASKRGSVPLERCILSPR